MCIQPTDDVTAKEAGVVSHGRTLRTYSNTRCMVFGMDTSVLAPTPSPWYRIDILGENSLFLGQNYPMMVKGDPTVVDTTLLVPFMRSNCIYTSDISVVPYPGPDICRFSLDDQYCDAIQYEGLVFAATTHGTVFAWNPYGFGMFVFHRNYNCFIHMHAG